MGVLSIVDRGSLEDYVDEYAAAFKANEKIELKGGEVVASPKGYPMRNPWLDVRNAARDNMRKFRQEYGLTAASRTRIRVEKKKPVDPFLAYQKKRA